MKTINAFLDAHPRVCLALVFAGLMIVGAIEQADLVAQGITH